MLTAAVIRGGLEDATELLGHYLLALRVVVGPREAAHAASVLGLRDGANFAGGRLTMLIVFPFVCLVDVDLLVGGKVSVGEVRFVLLVQNLTLLLDLLRRCTYCYKRKRIVMRGQTKLFRFANAKWTSRVALLGRGMIQL